MPKREDDFWASQKEGLRYCAKHKRYYRADVGCQLCMFERLGTKRKGNDNPRLQECPDCHEHSLFWDKNTKLYECLNVKCKRKFTEDDLRRDTGVRGKEVEEAPTYRPSKTDEKYPFDPDHVGYYRGGYSTRGTKSDKPTSTLTSMLYLTIWLVLGVALFSFGFLRIATWLNWLSLPWLDGWAEFFIWFIPWEVFVVLIGLVLIFGAIFGKGFGRGVVALALTIIIYGVVIVTVAPDIPNIIFWSGQDGERYGRACRARHDVFYCRGW